MKHYKYVIGIDPGTKTGFAVWNREEKRFLEISTLDILEAIERISFFHVNEASIFVRIEDPHQRKWFGNNSDAKKQGAGSVKRDFKIFRDYFERIGIPYHAYNPKDVRTKVDAKTFKKITGHQGRTSNHARDAAMSVYGF